MCARPTGLGFVRCLLTQLASMARLVAWQEELVAAVLCVNLGAAAEPPRPGCITAPPASRAAVTAADALSADPGAFVDTVLLPVLSLPAAARHRQSPLAYLLASFARCEAVAQVSGATGRRAALGAGSSGRRVA